METRRPNRSSADSLECRRSPSPEHRPWLARAASSSSVLLVALACVAPDASRAQPVPGQVIVVEIQDLRSERGEVLAGVYASSSGWLRETVGDCRAPIRAGRARCVFTVLGSARLAMAGLHDENGNDDMDRDLFGFPQEGYFFSNDVRGAFGPPSFEAAAFSVPQNRQLVVHARYGI